MSDPALLAERVFEHVCRTGAVNTDLLLTDPVTALQADDAIELSFVPRSTLPMDCSIAACYLRGLDRGRILVADDASPGRRAFSALHEYCHHLRDGIDELVDALWAAPDGGRLLEERVCDAFAARVLAPPGRVLSLLGGGVTAHGVLRLFKELPASREACAVAAARAMRSAGYVMLIDAAGIAAFTARAGDVFPVRRGTPQRSSVVSAVLSSGTHTGVGRLTYASGAESPEYLVDAAYGEPYRVAVWAEHSPGWGGLTVGLATDIVRNEGYCEQCGSEFVTLGTKCGECDEPRCPKCGQCACTSPPPTSGARRCDNCFLELPARCFASPTTQVCTDCS